MSEKSIKKIVLIGGAGFIGSWVSKSLINLKHQVFIIDPYYNYSNTPQQFLDKVFEYRQKYLLKGAQIYQLDYLEEGTKLLEKIQPSIVVNLAAIPIEGSNDEVLSKKQLIDQTILLEAITSDVRKLENCKYIYLSSIMAYGDINDWSVSEKNPLSPKTPYGISKAMGEFITKSYLDNWLIIRTTSVYGFADANQRVIQLFLNKALKKEEIWVNKDALLDLTYVKDLAQGVLKVVFSKYNQQVFHITSGKAILLPEVVREIAKYFPKLKYQIQGKVNDRPSRGTMDITKARILLEWEPKFDFKQGLKDYIKYIHKFKFA